jgi:hypothetical protein
MHRRSGAPLQSSQLPHVQFHASGTDQPRRSSGAPRGPVCIVGALGGSMRALLESRCRSPLSSRIRASMTTKTDCNAGLMLLDDTLSLQLGACALHVDVADGKRGCVRPSLMHPICGLPTPLLQHLESCADILLGKIGMRTMRGCCPDSVCDGRLLDHTRMSPHRARILRE